MSSGLEDDDEDDEDDEEDEDDEVCPILEEYLEYSLTVRKSLILCSSLYNYEKYIIVFSRRSPHSKALSNPKGFLRTGTPEELSCLCR